MWYGMLLLLLLLLLLWPSSGGVGVITFFVFGFSFAALAVRYWQHYAETLMSYREAAFYAHSYICCLYIHTYVYMYVHMYMILL